MGKIRELLEIIDRQNMVPDDFRYFEYERKLLNKMHAVVPELRALLAERDALIKLILSVLYWDGGNWRIGIHGDTIVTDLVPQELQSILNPTLSEGERG